MVEMPVGKEMEAAVMVTVWVCTRGGCGWEHSPMSCWLFNQTLGTTQQPFYLIFLLTKCLLINIFGNNNLVNPLPTTSYHREEMGNGKYKARSGFCKNNESKINALETVCGRKEHAHVKVTRHLS